MANFTFDGLKLTGEGKKFLAELNKLADMEVHVGFQSGDASYEDGTDLALVAAYNEFGSSDTPARPFMKQSFENHEAELKAVCQDANNIIAKGGSAETALKRIGAVGVGLVQEEIVNGGFAPNAPSTIKQKGSSQPLIDTGLMRQSVKYEIKEGT